MISWTSSESHLILNPRLSSEEKSIYVSLYEKNKRESHIFLTSSGSSQNEGESAKLIALSKKAFLVSAESVNNKLNLQKNDIWLKVLPSFHVGGLSQFARAYLKGADVIDISDQAWNPAHFCKICNEKNISISSLVPTQLYDLLNQKLPVPKKLQKVLIGGARLSPHLYTKAVAQGWPILPSYGMTEVASQIATAELGSPDLYLLDHVQVKLNSAGCLSIKSESLLTGYAQKTSNGDIWVNPVVEGWYQTQDFCEIQNQLLIPKGRITEYIKINGEGVSLLKLQDILDEVAEAFSVKAKVSAVDCDRKGYQIQINITESLSLEKQNVMRSAFNQKVMPYERADKVVVLESISKTWKG